MTRRMNGYRNGWRDAWLGLEMNGYSSHLEKWGDNEYATGYRLGYANRVSEMALARRNLSRVNSVR